MDSSDLEQCFSNLESVRITWEPDRNTGAHFSRHVTELSDQGARAVGSPQVYDGKDSSSRPLGAFTRNELVGLILNSTSNHLW